MGYKFTGKIHRIENYNVMEIPIEISEKFSTRGLVMISGTIDNKEFVLPAEPDGKGSHWLNMDDELLDSSLSYHSLEIDTTEDWPEPQVPEDLQIELESTGTVEGWLGTTTRARWDWLRWLKDTKNPDTYKKRLGVLSSKLSKGSKRPCCFDRNRCCIPAVSKSGKLIEGKGD